MKATPFLTQGLSILVQNGQSTSFWFYTWIDDEPLFQSLTRDITLLELYSQVCDYWIPSQGWGLSKLVGSLPPRVKNKLAAFILCEDSSMEDEIC